MIKIKITTEEIENVKAPCGHIATKCRSNAAVSASGDYQTLKMELVCLLESIEKNEALAKIWSEAIGEHIDNQFLYGEKDEESDDNDEE